jgi:hypothetical protein
MYIILTIKTDIQLGTRQENIPKLYLFLFPIFWNAETAIAKTDIIKYTYDGVHN